MGSRTVTGWVLSGRHTCVVAASKLVGPILLAGDLRLFDLQLVVGSTTAAYSRRGKAARGWCICHSMPHSFSRTPLDG